MNDNEQSVDGLTETKIQIPVQSGDRKVVPALVHKACPGLAVTMIPFGAFQVTHVNTGKKLCGLYQRASSALLSMSHWALIADMMGVAWADLDQAGASSLISEAKDRAVPFDGATSTSQGVTRKMTVGEWFQTVRIPFLDEFPWEDTDPFEDAITNLEKIEVPA